MEGHGVSSSIDIKKEMVENRTKKLNRIYLKGVIVGGLISICFSGILQFIYSNQFSAEFHVFMKEVWFAIPVWVWILFSILSIMIYCYHLYKNKKQAILEIEKNK